MACTEICNKINDLQLKDHQLPSYNDLVAHLACSAESLRSGVPLGTLEAIFSRASCSFCVLVCEAVRSALGIPEFTPTSLRSNVHLLLLKDEQFFRLSYPSPHGTRLCFVADDSSQISGPGLARRVDETSIRPSTIVKWLDTCDKAHRQTCYHDRSQEPVCDFRSEIAQRLTRVCRCRLTSLINLSSSSLISG